ncbi:MAG: phosphoglycolate phosphatase [Hyphomicrobiales bacterium]|jgi:phosphoglycolate phosphatase|nr:phosphoglycolate phosphatase [Hyphomicrobiales bacterium]
MPAPTIVFDLDGTLVDTAPDLIDTLNVILARHDVAPVDFDQARSMIGAGVKPLLVRGLASQGVQLPPDEIDLLFGQYREVYAAHIADRSRPFPGLEAALDALAAQGCRLAVCTNKLEWLSVRLLDTLGLSSRFVAICGQDTFAMRKPDPDMLRLTIGRAGGDAGHAVMVGDSMTDVATAQAAGVPVIAVDFGYTDIAPAELGADRLISHFDALPAAVMELVSLKT